MKIIYNGEMNPRLCRDVLGSPRLTLRRRADMFLRLYKKLLTILAETEQNQPGFFNSAAICMAWRPIS